MSPAAAWTCPACGRRVPPRVDVCRCGAHAPAFPADRPTEAPPSSSHASPSGTVWLAAITLLVAVVTFIWRGTVGIAPAPTPGPAVAAPDTSADPPAAAVASPPTIAPGAVPTPTPVVAITPTPVPTPATAISAATASLEDVIARSLVAVVMVETPTSRGTGFFVAPDVVITNDHVVGHESVVTLRLHDGATRPARVERTATDVDLAVLRVAGGQAPAVLTLGAAESARVGQEVLAIGSALGLQSTVTRGIVSAKRRSGAVALIQTDAAINPGNSGGPLLDRDGIVLGVTTLKAGGSAEGVGFAIAAEHVRAVIDGRTTTAAVAASVTTASPGASALPPVGATTDDARATNLAALERDIKTLAEQAAQIDAQWERFAPICRPRSTRDGDRAWFSLATAPPVLDGGDANCGRWLGDLTRAAATFTEAMRSVGEATRRAGLLPGDLRSLRRQYRLDWVGFDR